MLQIKTQLTNNKKAQADESSLGFGVYYTDHMLIIDHDEEQGWHDARIVPYGPLSLDPAAMVFHYGDGILRGPQGIPHAGRLDPAVPPG